MTTPTQGEHAQTELAHELFAAAQLAPGEGIEDAVSRIAAALATTPVVPEVVLELPAGDTRNANVYWSEIRGETLHLCISVDPPAQPAAPQGVAYAELPESSVKDGSAYVAGTIFTADDMRDFGNQQFNAGREFEAARIASHGQAPAGAADEIDGCHADMRGTWAPGQRWQSRTKGDAEWKDIGQPVPSWSCKKEYRRHPDDTPAAQAAPALAENGHLTQAGHDLLMGATLAGATLVSKGRLVGDMAQAESQPAPVPEWLPFSKRTQIADRHGVKVTAEFNALVRDVIQTYLETHADRAARAQADSVLEDAARWRAWATALVEAGSAPHGVDTPFMKEFERAVGDADIGFTLEQLNGWIDTAIAALSTKNHDAARKQGASHD